MPLTRLPPLNSLRAFEAAARRGSIKDAASELSVTPGAISQQIKSLEADLGVQLFTRKTRAIHLTPAGVTLQPKVSEAFLQIRQAVDQVRPIPMTQIRINSSGAIISKWLLPRLHKFTRLRHDVQVHIETDPYLSDMTKNSSDVVIRYTDTPPKDLYYEEIHKELLLPVASPSWLDSHDVTHPDDIPGSPILQDTSLTVFGRPTSWESWCKTVGKTAEIDFTKAITFERHAADQVVDAAVAGAGIAICRSLLAYQTLSDGRLICPFGPVIESGLSYYVCCAKGREKESHIRDFLNWVCEEASVLTTLNSMLAPST